MPRMYAYAGAVPWVDLDPRLTLASLYEDTTLGYWTSVNGRMGVLAKAMLDLNDQTTVETSRRFDRIETLLEDRLGEVKAEIGEVRADLSGVEAGLGEVKAGLGEVKADLGEVKAGLGEVKADLAELKSTVNRIDARVEQQATWIAKDEAKGRERN